jgi:hypothetical protein
MNPYKSYSELLFTCVNGPKIDVVNTMLAAFNEPRPSDVEQAFMAGSIKVEVFEGGVSKVYRRGDPLPARDDSVQYFAKEIPLDLSLAYVDRAERNTAKEHRIVFWEPNLHAGTTALMGLFADGMSHTIWSLSRRSPYRWINIRIYDGDAYPGCFFDFYADCRKVLRRLMACKDEDGWEFGQEGPVQPFEEPDYYRRRLIRDRLNREIITKYMEKLGFLIAQDGFWKTDKVAHFLWQERPGGTRRR